MSDFDADDFEVFGAHSLVEREGYATLHDLRQFIPGLPAQRLMGMKRRGLLRRGDGFLADAYALTEEGRRQAYAYLDGLVQPLNQDERQEAGDE